MLSGKNRVHEMTRRQGTFYDSKKENLIRVTKYSSNLKGGHIIITYTGETFNAEVHRRRDSSAR